MTTIRQIITDAFRESGLIAAGDTPEADVFDEALRRIQSLIKSFFGNELGDPLETLNYGQSGLTNTYGQLIDMSSWISDTYVPSNVRLIFNIAAATTLFMPPNPRDGARLSIIDNVGNFATYPVTLNGNGRAIETAATVTLNTDSLNREWFYRADLGSWVRITDLTASSETPFPEEFNDLLITWLALRLHPRFGAETRPETIDVLGRMKRLFRSRYKQDHQMRSEEGLLRLPSTHGYWDYIYSPDDQFNHGIV